MVFHMKTTLVIDDGIMVRLKQEAARTGKTLSELVEAALRSMLDHQGKPVPKRLESLPTFRGGAPLVEISDRDALYQAMEGR
jgi:hypothetical protein